MARQMQLRGQFFRILRLIATLAILAILLSLPHGAGANRLAAQTNAQTSAQTNAQTNAQADDKVLTMEKLEVNAARFRWTHAQTARFEILSNLEETKFVASVVNQAERIIALYEKASPLFNPQRDLPVKLIFIQDEMIERLFSQANIGSTQDDFDERMAGSPFHKDTQQFKNSYKISAFGNYNDEQLVIVKFLTKGYMASPQLESEKSIECAADLAVTYLDECAQIHAGGKKITWLDAALNAMRGHSYGGNFPLPRDFASPVYGSGSYYRTGWIAMNAGSITLGRYCLKCELDALRTAVDFPRTLDARKALWAQFLLSPDAISLGDIFNGKYTPLLIKAQLIEQQLAMQREVHDFMYYCLFGPDPDARDAFAKLVLAAADTAAPIDESLFQKTFGAGYATFQTRMYDYYRQLAQDDTLCADNPWGATGLTIKLTPSPDATNAAAANIAASANTAAVANTAASAILKPADFKLSRRGDTTRIISDWFDVINAGANARASLLKAWDESIEASQDPQFIATLGLNEARYGDRLKAMGLLEKAAAAGIARPSVYRTLARLYLDNIIDLKGRDYQLAPVEFAAILAPLTTALAQPPANPENYVIYAAACERTGVKSPMVDQNLLIEGCRQFPDNIDMLEKVLPSLAACGYKTEAATLARESARLPLPPEKKQRLDKLIEKLGKKGSG